MKLKNICFENYKTFAKQETIEIHPLTILIGRNNSGKSVIARLPLLMASALSDQAEAPIDLNFALTHFNIDFGASFLDLIHDRFPHGAFSLGATVVADSIEQKFCSKFQYFDEYKLLLVSDFEYIPSEGPPITLTWYGRDPLDEPNKYYLKEIQQSCEVIFQGLFPQLIRTGDNQSNSGIESIQSTLNKVRQSLVQAMEPITYLGPFRKSPQRTYRFGGTNPQHIGLSGEKVFSLLGDDFLRRRGKVVTAVGNWFAEYLGGWSLNVSKQGEMFSLVLCQSDNPAVEINIADTGIGISQVLPIVVQRQFEITNQLFSNIEIVEQPELHLHPGAHGDVADLYVTSLQYSNTRFIIETHSENFLLRIRRRVAEGLLKPQQVIIYWINDELGKISRVLPIHLNEAGEVDKWPSQVFAEDFEEVRAIRMVQRQRD